MDVLFKSIDVRDLLSTTDADDPSTPLSAPDLHLLIERLQVRSIHIKSRVQDYLRSHQLEFSSLFSQCSDVVSKSEQLSGRLLDLISLISDNPADNKIKDVIQEIVAKRKDVREKKELLEILGIVLELYEKLRLVKEDIEKGKIKEASEALRELKAALRIHDEVVVEEAKKLAVYELLKNEWSVCFEKEQEVLIRFMDSAVKFEQAGNKVRVKYWLSMNEAGGVELHTVLEAMNAVGILDYGLARVADLVIKHVVNPVVRSGSTVSSLEEISDHQGKTSEAVLQIISSTYPMINSLDGETIFSSLVKVVEFIKKSLCYGNGSWMRSFGRLTWPRMSELIISHFLSKVVPNDASKLADFQKVVQLSSDFEAALEELMFISPSNGKDKRLSEFADNVEVHFASRKKVEILAETRCMLLRAGFSIPPDLAKVRLKSEETDKNSSNHLVDLLFTSEKCVVTDAALKLMELVHRTLKDVCLSSPRVGLEFYHAARDALLLYEAIVPVKLEKQLDAINQAAVLIHNDCLYLSQEILGLAFEYRPGFPSPVKELAVFVDLAPRFQKMSEHILERQIQLVILNLKQAIDGADGFQNTHLTKKFESAKFSIDQVAFILEKVHIIWEPLLMPSIYKKSICMVLEVIFSRISKDILLLDDMAAEETLQLQRLIHLLFENLSSIIESLLAMSQSVNSEGVIQSIDDLIPSHKKLRKLEDLLDMPLKSITIAWESGELGHCGFSAMEVEDFIRAIFTDSSLRRDCLLRIQSTM